MCHLIKDIYFFEVHSSNVLKISASSRVHSKGKIDDIFNIFDEIFLVFTKKKVNFLFILYFSGQNRNADRFNNNFFVAISHPFPLVQHV